MKFKNDDIQVTYGSNFGTGKSTYGSVPYFDEFDGVQVTYLITYTLYLRICINIIIPSRVMYPVVPLFKTRTFMRMSV